MITALDPDLATSWKNSPQTFDELVTMFNLVKDDDDSSSPSAQKRIYGLTSADFEEKAKEESEFLAFKTPRPKRRKPIVEDEFTLPELKDIMEGLQADGEEISGSSTIHSLFKELDGRSKLRLQVLKNHVSSFEEERNINATCNQNEDISLSCLKMNVGDRPEFDAPSLWLSLASVATELSTMGHSGVKSNWKQKFQSSATAGV